MEERILALLRRNGMYAPDIDPKTLSAVLLGQLRLSFYGGESSVPVRLAGLPLPAPAAGEGPYTVALLGRRTLRTACLHPAGDFWDFTEGESFETPGSAYPATLSELLYAVAELCAPLLEESGGGLVLCPDFPLKTLPGGDHAFTDLPPALALKDWEERPLRTLLREELARRGLGTRKVFVCSAAAATLLDGLTPGRGGRLLGLRWGLGLSAAFAAPPIAVVKLGSGERRPVLFDAGLGGCVGVPFAPPDLAMDRDSHAPGRDLLEKMVSTGELGERFRFTILKAAEARLLTFMCGRDFLSLRSLSLETLLEFLQRPEGDGLLARFCAHDVHDREVALLLGHAVLDRAARLVCASLLAMAELVGLGGHNPGRVSLSGEALEAPLLYEKLEAQLAALGGLPGLELCRAEEPCFTGACRAAHS